MDKRDKIWMYLGATVLAVVSSLPLLYGNISPLAPMPVHLIFLVMFIPYGIPLIYMIEFEFLRNRDLFGKAVLAAALVISVSNGIYFWLSWEYGVIYRGKTHTVIVAVENIVGFFVLVALAYLGVKNNSKVLMYSANLLLFLLLSWCAFPYLGEMI